MFARSWQNQATLAPRSMQKVTKNHENIIKMGPKIMKNRGCVADTFLERFWRDLERKVLPNLILLGSILDQFSLKNRKNCIPKNIQKSMPKKYRKLMPKGSKMRPKWSPKFAPGPLAPEGEWWAKGACSFISTHFLLFQGSSI